MKSAVNARDRCGMCESPLGSGVSLNPMTNSMPMNRRAFLQKSAALGGAVLTAPVWGGVAVVAGRGRKTDVRIEEVSLSFTEFVYRAPVKFAGAIMDRATLLTVQCRVSTREGKTASGAGYMPFNHIFSYPSKTLTHEAKNNAMKALAQRLVRVTGQHREHGHPLELNAALAPEYLKAAADISAELRLADAIPKLCTLVTASAFDAAIHDAYGKAHGVSVFATYNAEFMAATSRVTSGRTSRDVTREIFCSRRRNRRCRCAT